MLDVVRADFAGDNVGCWMQIQVGKGPWASEVSGLVKIGQTMTMVLAIKDDEQKFDHVLKRFGDGKNLLGVSPYKSIVYKRTIKLL